MNKNNLISAEECMDELREKIYQTLKERNCTMKEIAEQCGVSHDAISVILSGKRTGIRLVTFLNISYGMGLCASSIIADAENRKGGAENEEG